MGNTLGVQRLVTGRGYIPANMPVGFVEQLISNCDDQGFFDPSGNACIGDTVELVAGPFAGLVGEISDMPEEGRLGVLLELMGR